MRVGCDLLYKGFVKKTKAMVCFNKKEEINFGQFTFRIREINSFFLKD